MTAGAGKQAVLLNKGSGFRLRGCTVDGNNLTSECVQVSGSTSLVSDVVIENCIIKDAGSAGENYIGIVVGDYASNVTIRNNTIQDNRESGILVFNSAGSGVAIENAPIDVYIYDNVLSGSTNAPEIEIGYDVKDTKIYRNTVFDGATTGISLDTCSTGVEIYNNIVYGACKRSGV